VVPYELRVLGLETEPVFRLMDMAGGDGVYLYKKCNRRSAINLQCCQLLAIRLQTLSYHRGWFTMTPVVKSNTKD
jgi:hypothetical protein